MINYLIVIKIFMFIIIIFDTIIFIIKIKTSNKKINMIKKEKITSYYTSNSRIYVMNKNKEILSFIRHGNNEFLEFLKNNYKEIFLIRGDEISSLIYRIFGYAIVIIAPLDITIALYSIVIGGGVFLLGLNESKKRFFQINEKFIYKNLIMTKSISFRDITNITYEMFKGYGKYGYMGPITYIIKIYKNDKCYIKIKVMNKEQLDLLKKISTTHKIKMRKIN